MARLRFKLLGEPEVWLDGEQLTVFSTAKTAALLYYLAATGTIHSRETLAGLLWGEMPEAKAKRNLTKSLSVLRRLLAPFLLIAPQRVGFLPEASYELDIEALLAEVANDSLTGGDFLQGFHVKGAPLFDEWLTFERERLRGLLIERLEQFVATALQQGDYAAGVANGRLLLAQDPWRESAHRQLMLLLARSGQYHAAIAQFERCRQLLADELGVEPTAKTAQLHEQIQAARGVAVQEEVTAVLPPILGRETELAHIQSLLTDSDCRLVTILGLGGIGKTRLARAAARQINREGAIRFLNGVVFISLAEAHNLPLAMCNALYISPGRQPEERLIDSLRHKEMLLVLDNFEHLLAERPFLLKLLASCPQLKCLVTSREPLQLDGEWRVALQGLAFPVAHEEGTVTSAPFAAVELFKQVAAQADAAFSMSADDLALVGRLCQLVEGMPLAIKLAAAWVRVLTVADIVAELEAGIDILATTLINVPSRQRSLRAIFVKTWTLLNKKEQQILVALSVFRGDCTRQAARTVAGANPLALAGLLDHGLVQLEAQRYQLHALTRQFAAEKLAEQAETGVFIQTAHRDHYAEELATLAPKLLGAAPHLARDQLLMEVGNIEQAWRTAIAQQAVASLLQMAYPLYQFYVKQGWAAAGRELLQTAVPLASPRTERGRLLRGQLLAFLGVLNGRLGQFELANQQLDDGLALAQRAENPALIGFILIERGHLLRQQAKFDEARRHFQESLTIANDSGNRRLKAQALEHLGLMASADGKHETAMRHLQQALALLQAEQDVGGEARTRNSLGLVMMTMGHQQTAIDHFNSALAIQKKLENWLAVDSGLINLGIAAANLGDYGQSQAYYEESLQICRRIGDEVGVAYCLTGLGKAALALQNLAEARQLLVQSLALNRSIGRRQAIGSNLLTLGDIEKSEDDLVAAQMRYEQALATYEAIGWAAGCATAEEKLGALVTVAEQP